MTPDRRAVLQAGSAAGLQAALAALGLLPAGPAAAQTFSDAVFQAKSTAETLKALGVTAPANSTDIVISAAEIAENGMVVPVGVRSALPNTQSISLLIDKNPSPMAGGYELFPGMEPEVSMRVKMSQTSDVIAIVRADGKFYQARKEIKVTLGGCGG